jgi:hypothetical protein
MKRAWRTVPTPSSPGRRQARPAASRHASRRSASEHTAPHRGASPQKVAGNPEGVEENGCLGEVLKRERLDDLRREAAEEVGGARIHERSDPR